MGTEVVSGRVLTKAERDQQALLAALTELGSSAVGDDSIIFEGTQLVLPKNLEGDEGVDKAIKTLRDWQRQQDSTFEFSRTFDYRPHDGAAAFDRAMRRVFGTAGIGKTWYSFFGTHRPQLVTVECGWGKTVQVPWDQVELPILDATFDVSLTRDREKGFLSHISVEAPRKHRAIIEGFFKVVEDELANSSIYRGGAITAADENPGFFNHLAVNPDRVVYTAHSEEQLYANVWSVIDYAHIMRDNNLPLKRAFLLEGTYGVGKTQAGAITAQHAVAHGWTFILVRPEDDPLMAIRTAQLYSPAVVWVEDVDNLANKKKSRAGISAVLDAMDGIAAKNTDIIVGFTTNFPDVIDKGMLRPGRVDAVIHLGELDRPSTERLIKVTVDKSILSEDVDYDAVFAAFQGHDGTAFVPAYAVEAAQRAVRYSIARNQGRPSTITTEDLVKAGAGLRDQLEMMLRAPESADKHTMEDAVKEAAARAVEAALNRTELKEMGVHLAVTPANGIVAQ